jgi:precorrin-2 dehydrogenase/sirohydrochlorin ferrochelatase
MPAYYPMFLDLRGRRVIVVGGNLAAARKVQGLLDCDAAVTLIAPKAVEPLEQMADSGKLTWLRRGYRRGDLKGAFIALVPDTSDPKANEHVFAEAQALNVPVNVEDVPRLCTFIAPSIVRRGDVAVAVSTGGASPALARKFRETLSGTSPLGLRHNIMDYADLAPLLSEARLELRRQHKAVSNEHWQACLTDDLVDIVQAGQADAARKALMAALTKGIGCGCLPGTCVMWDELVSRNKPVVSRSDPKPAVARRASRKR